MDELAARFDFSGMGKGQAKFDRAKLLAFNADAIAALGDDAFASRWRAWASHYDPSLNERFSAEQMRTLAPAVKTRCKTLADARSVLVFAFVDDDAIEYDGKAVHKALLKGGAKGLELLRAFRDKLATVEPFEPEPIEHAVAAFAESSGVGIGKIAQPVRVAVTGSGVSPPLGQTLAIIGQGRDARPHRPVRRALRRAGLNAPGISPRRCSASAPASDPRASRALKASRSAWTIRPRASSRTMWLTSVVPSPSLSAKPSGSV